MIVVVYLDALPAGSLMVASIGSLSAGQVFDVLRARAFMLMGGMNLLMLVAFYSTPDLASIHG